MAKIAHTPSKKRLHMYSVPKSIAVLMLVTWSVIGVLTGIFLISGGKMSQLGSRASVDQAVLKVTKLQYRTTGEQPYPVPSGLKFAIVTVEITNHSPETFDFAPVIQTVVTDEAGRSWPMSPATIANPIKAGPIARDATVSGEISFLVPVDAQKLTFVFDPVKPNGYSAKYILGQ